MAKTLHVFLSTMQSVNYLFTNGKAAVFQFGRYLTDSDSEATHLDAEIANGHPHIFRPTNEAERTIQSDELDPMSRLRKQLREEIIKEERNKTAAAVNPTNDMGFTAATQVTPAGSNIFEEMTQIAGANSMASDSLAKLVNLPRMAKAPAV